MEKGDFFKHFKGNFYVIVDIATDSTTLDDVVIYRRVEPSMTKLWTRPLKEFEDIHPSGVKRFTNVLDLPKSYIDSEN